MIKVIDEEALYVELVNECKKYMDNKELSLIEKAYHYANQKHHGQARKSGEDYIIHPLSVAIILTTIKADNDTICAGILHDVLEDTTATKEELKKEFNETIANLVDGVTKINDLKVSTENDYLITYYKKIIVGMSTDVRVIILKLADRLHNMRTLYALAKHRQIANAKETIEILAPIAHRLGMYKIKSELEDLSLRYLKPEAYFDVVEKLNNSKAERESNVYQMMDEVSALLNANNIKHEIRGRAKSIYSIFKKLDKGRSFSDIYDVLACRILVEKDSDCYLALGLIHSKYKPVAKRFKDYVAMPKTNLYQSLHTTVFGLGGNFFEIQIRTYEMDEIAEKGVATHWAYKENKAAALEMQNITEQKLQFYKSIIELNEEQLTNEEFYDAVKDEVLNDNIYVYTPKGDVFELPKGSNPIDFAYRIHSDVGNKMTGAIVNNNMVPINHELNNLDVVKIITNNNSVGPSREWVNMAKSTQAKNRIKQFFNKNAKENYIEIGKNSLEKELRRKKISITNFMKQENIIKVLAHFKLKDLDELYFDIGNNKFSATSVVMYDQKQVAEKAPVFKPDLNKKTNENDIIVGDIDNILTKVASCCTPVPGDEIIGYITKGSGISIHRINCQNINHIDDRTIKPKWNEVTKNKYTAGIIVYTDSKDNMVVDIVQTATNTNVTIENIKAMAKDIEGIYTIAISVNNLEEVKKFMLNLEKINHIKDVERIMQ